MAAKALVIGGGAIGLSAAYHLARRGFGQVQVLEKERLGDGASSRAAGIITGHMWSETGARARQISLARFRELSAELSGYRFCAAGCLNLFSTESWPEREKLLPLYERLGIACEVLSAVEMRRRWPALCVDEACVGLFDPLGGYSEPDEYLPALSRACRQLGVDICEGQPVLDFLRRGERVVGARTPEGSIEADAVVCTVHVWTLKLLERLGLPCPLKAFVHQRYVTTPLDTEIALPAVNANPQGGYVRPAPGGRLLVGLETPERSEYRVADSAFRMDALDLPAQLAGRAHRALLPLVPALAGSRWESAKVGLISFSLDGEPLLGAVPGAPGLYVGCGFHSGGFAYNPAAGLLLAELVAEGRTSLDLSAFAPGRFAAREAEEFLRCDLTQGEYARDYFARRH